MVLKINLPNLLLSIILFYFLVSCQPAEQRPRGTIGRELYPNGKLQGKGALLNGKKHGLWLSYNENGSISSEHLYYQDSLNGEYIGYFEATGDTLIVGNYVNGQEQGEWKSYYGNDLLARKAYFQDGKKVGVWEYYKEDGRLCKKVAFDGEVEKVLFDRE